MRPLRATINLSALQSNFLLARDKANGAANIDPVRVWSVIKANAYGHGVLRVAQTLRNVGDGFAMLELEAAIMLREAGFQHPILLLEGFFNDEEIKLLAEYRLTPVLHTIEQVRSLLMTTLPRRLPIYLKLNTGMNRLGLNADNFSAALLMLESASQVESITLMTHFSDADGEPGIEAQLIRFHHMTAGLNFPVSLANSAALLRFPETRVGWVRPGIMLYGSSPFPEIHSASEIGLRPVMSLESQIISIQRLSTGDKIGYGGLFSAPLPMSIGVVACGYADGYPRHAPTGTPILVEGIRTRTLGRVSMDMLYVDLTDIPDAGIGSPATLWGEGLPIDEVAAAANTVSYELLCALAPRVPIVEVRTQ